MKAYSEEDIIKRLKAGDEEVFKFLFDHYYRPLTLFAVKYVGDVEDAREVVQEFFIRLWAKHDQLQIQFSLKMYLYQSVRNACINNIESKKVEQRRMSFYNVPQFTQSNALEHMLAAEQEELLMQAIDNLPEKCRQIFLMSRTEKLSNKAIADRLNISVKTVETQISIALKRLRDLLIVISLLLSALKFF